MVSPELLRRYPFFAFMTHDQLRAVAMITDEIAIDADVVLFESGQNANELYLLRDGNVELHVVVVDERGMEKRQDFLVGMINPGELVGVSAMIRPYKYTTAAIVTEASHLLKINAFALRLLCEDDARLAAEWQSRISEVTLERLQAARVQLLAAV